MRGIALRSDVAADEVRTAPRAGCTPSDDDIRRRRPLHGPAQLADVERLEMGRA